MTTESVNEATLAEVSESQKNLVLVVYILQAASFIVGITAIAAIIVNYIKRDEVRGTWLESHFSWQIKTFWWGLLGGIVGILLSLIVIGIPLLFVVPIWVIYRIIKGWLAYNDGKPMPDTFV